MKQHINSLDGLRTVAFLAVLGFHTGEPIASCGWLGVDIFFVLSGYLITSRLLAEQDRTGRIRLGRFWGRRLARLYPALVVTTTLCVVAAALGVGVAGEITATRVMAVLGYVTDFWMVSGRHVGPLEHTWTLSVEEQFYLLWPLVFWAMRTRSRIVAAATVGAVISFAVMVLSGQPDGHLTPSVSYFGVQSRLWELLVGCVLAVVAPVLRERLPLRGIRWCAWISVILVVGTILSGPKLPYQSAWQVLVVVLSTALLLFASESNALPMKVLAFSPLTWLGKRSYGGYLYHFPILWMCADLLRVGRLVSSSVAFAMTLAVAGLSYRFVEVPIQSRANLKALQAETIDLRSPAGREVVAPTSVT